MAEPTKNVLTTTQWLSVISISVSLVGVYYKREEIKSVFTKKNSVETPRVSPSLPRALPPHHCPLTQPQREKWASERWIKHFILFYNNGECCSCFNQSCRRQWSGCVSRKTRHDKALEAYQAAMEKYTRERTQLLDWIETNRWSLG